jgi:putative membrane protein
MMDWGDTGGWAWWWMVPMMMFMIVVIGAAIWAFLASTRSNVSTGQPARPTPEEILNERFARGEIDSAEYRERIDALHDNRPAAHH